MKRFATGLAGVALAIAALGFGVASRAQRSKAKPAARVYAFDAAQSQLTLVLSQEGLISRRSPTHRVAAKSFSGRIALPKDEARMTVEVETDAKSLTNVDEFMGDFERKEFHHALRNLVLETEKYPTIRFASTAVADLRKTGANREFVLSGDLTLHGVTKRVSFPVKATIAGEEIRASGEAKLKQTDFGMKPFEKGLGLIKIGDEMKIVFSILAKPH